MMTGPHGRELTVAPEGTSTARNIGLTAAGDQTVDGLPVQAWQASRRSVTADGAPTVTLEQLLSMTGGRLPVGLSVGRTPGPFLGAMGDQPPCIPSSHKVIGWSAPKRPATAPPILTGGGLTAAKTVSVGGLPSDWSTVQRRRPLDSGGDHRRATATAPSDSYGTSGFRWRSAVLRWRVRLAAIASVRSDRSQI